MKFKRVLSAGLSAVLAAGCVTFNAAADVNEPAAEVFDEVASGGAVMTEAENVSLAESFSFGSEGVLLSAGTYDIGVSLKNASNIANASMAASCVTGGSLTVNDDGTAKVKVSLTSVTIATLTAWASDWKIYQGTSASGDTVYADTVLNADGNVESIEFDLPDNSYDGVYVNMTIADIGMNPDAYIAFDYTNDGENGEIGDNGGDDETVYIGTATVDTFGYDVTVYVTVSDGVITAITVEGSNYSESLEGANSARLEMAAEGIAAEIAGLSATDSSAIDGIDAVSGATYSCKAIKTAVLDALGLAIEEAVEVADGDYTADIDILKIDSDDTSSAARSFETTAVPVTIEDGKAYVRLSYTSSMITKIEQLVESEYVTLDVTETGDENGTKYVVAELENVSDIATVQFTIDTGTSYGTMVNQARVKIATDTLTPVEETITVDDGSYTADIDILKIDSDDTSSAARSFETTAVPVTIEDGKAYVRLSYTSSMITKIEQLVDSEYITLDVTETGDENGTKYVVAELENVSDIATVQFTIDTGTSYGTMVNQARVRIATDTLTPVEETITVDDGNYTADIDILKIDSDDTSSAARSFETTAVPVTIEDGKAYVRLSYTSSMITKIEQLVDGEYITLDVTETGDENGTKYVVAELENVSDIATVQFTIDTGTSYGTMVNQARVRIATDTITAVEETITVDDGSYTADIDILKIDSDDTSSAARSFETTAVPVTIEDGKAYVRLSYTSSMITKIEQLVDGEYITLDVTETGDENGTKYVVAELENVSDIATVQFTIDTGTSYGTMVNQARVRIATDTLEAVETAVYTFGSAEIELEAGEYDIPVKLMKSSDITTESMAGSCLKSAVLTVNDDGSARLTVDLQAVSVGAISGWATDWQIFTGNAASGDTTAAEILATDENGNVTQIAFDITDNSLDGVYVSMYIDVMGATQTAYVYIDYSSIGSASVKTYTGTAHVDQFGGYDVTVTVTVQGGYITGITVEGSNFEGTYAAVNQAKLQSAAEGLAEAFNGLSASDASAVDGVDAVSSATYSSNAIKAAILNALSIAVEEVINVPTEALAEGTYTVDIAYYSDVVYHSLVENDTITATLTVDSEGNIKLSTDIINGTSKEPLYITAFNGYYENNDPEGELKTDAEVVMGDINYSDDVFAEGTQVVTNVTFPLEGDYAAIYYTNASIYVPAMKNLNGELEGIYFENGTFSSDCLVKVYWDTLEAETEDIIVDDGNYTADIDILKIDSDDTSSAARSFETTAVPVTIDDGKAYVRLSYTSSMITKIEQLVDSEYVTLDVTETGDKNGTKYVVAELANVSDIATVQFTIDTGTSYGTMVNQARVRIATDTLTPVEETITVDDGSYTADIDILKIDSDDTSSAARSFETTAVPVTIDDGKAYVRLSYTSSMITKIEQLVDGEYVTLEVTEVGDENGTKYVVAELANVSDIATVQFTIDTGTSYGTMVNQARVRIATDTLTPFEETITVDDGSYTADIDILKIDSDDTSSAARSFETTAVPVTIEDGKAYVRLSYTSLMITKIEQLVDSEYVTLEVTEVGDENGTKYVVAELANVSDIATVQFTIDTGTSYGTMVNQARVRIATDTLTVVTEEAETVVYSVPVKMMNASNTANESMGNGAIDGNAIVSVTGDTSVVKLNVKAVDYAGLYGHLLKLWSYPVSETMDYSWWNNSDYEISADIAEYFTDYGLNYTSGDTTTSEFPKAFVMERAAAKEDCFYIRISADAMAGFDQAAILIFDWDNAEVIEDSDDDIEISSPAITVSNSSHYNGETVTVSLTADDGAEVYYTTDGTAPTAASTAYEGEFTLSGSNETITIYAIAYKDGVSSAVSSYDVRFIAKTGDSSSVEDIADGKYWMDIYLWNANLDQASMGDSAFDNNRQALVTISGGKATVQVATNPVYVSGYTSALQGIKSSETSISVEDTSKFTTNTKYDGSAHSFTYASLFSFDISDLTTEYVKVQISVPYTPMDGITENTGGWIDARLKLDFSGMTEADSSDTLSPDSTISYGSSSSGGSSVNSTSTDTGVKIVADEGVFEDGTEFEITVLPSGTVYETALKTLGYESSDVTVYDMAAVYSGSEVAPTGQVTIYIPVGDTQDKNVVIYRLSEDGTEKTEIEHSLSSDKNYYVITVKELGIYALCVAGETSAELLEEENIELTEDIQNPFGFEDVDGHWAEEYIIQAVDLGLFSGMTETVFGPDVVTTRAMFVTVLGRLMDAPDTTNKNTVFEDISSDDYFYPYVVWAYENGIVSGISETEFDPYSNITREQMAAILYRLAESEGYELKSLYKTEFSDFSSVGSWAAESVTALAEAGIINGRTDGTFDPKGEATRAEIAVLLIRFIKDYMPEKAAALTAEKAAEDEVLEAEEAEETEVTEESEEAISEEETEAILEEEFDEEAASDDEA